MDRQIVYPGSIPLDTDLLYIQRHMMNAIGAFAHCVMGDVPIANGFSCGPRGANYQIAVTPGTLSEVIGTDSSPFGSLPADGTPLYRTGVNRAETVLQLGSPPDGSHVLCWLTQARVLEVDAGPIALPYWNAANPQMPFTGPANSGLSQNTQRLLQVALSCKASEPVPLGTYAPPAPDPGWVGLHCITTYFGQPVITQFDIKQLIDAPFLSYRLPDLAPGFSRQDVITASTAWRVPNGVRRIRVRLVGGGGGGGGGNDEHGGGGGGGGGFAEGIFGTQPGLLFSVVVGTGGAAGSFGISGGTGGTSLFADLLAATGGQGGGSANPDCHGGAGGAGFVGGLLQRGGCGTDGAMVANVPAGSGGMSAFGGGGRGAFLGGAPTEGQAAGSGAGGSYGGTALGGNGANGLVVIEY